MKRDDATAPEFQNVDGLQVYSKDELTDAQLKTLVSFDLYDAEQAKKMVDVLLVNGVLFLRDSLHSYAAVFNQGYQGPSFYSQLYYDHATREIVRIFVKNAKKEIVKLCRESVSMKG